MTAPRPAVAERVVWRHPCDCPTASRPLEAGEEPEHRFDVDGAPFPWHIAENGARFTKRGELYLVDTRVLPLERDGNGDVLDVTVSWWARNVRIGERWFPWSILDGSLWVDVDAGAFPVVHLVFLAHNVDADLEIPHETLDGDRSVLGA